MDNNNELKASEFSRQSVWMCQPPLLQEEGAMFSSGNSSQATQLAGW